MLAHTDLGKSEEVDLMHDLAVAIFRIAGLPDKSAIPEERYIALLPKHELVPESWHISQTLFGLQKKLQLKSIDWEEAEGQLATKGTYKLLREINGT
jgi:hypothetical protein